MLIKMPNRKVARTESGMLVIFTRKEIEDGSAIESVVPLLPLVSNDQTVIEGEGKLEIIIRGYEDDERALGEIVEIRRWFAKLTEQFPYWGHFCQRSNTMRLMVLSLLCDIAVERRVADEVMIVVIDATQAAVVAEQLIGRAVTLYHEVGIRRKDTIRLVSAMRNWFQ